MKPFFSLSVLLLSAVLMLTACAGSGEIRAIPLTPLPSVTPLPTPTPLPTATPVPMPTEAATLPAERVESCLVGRWMVSDASSYFQTAFQAEAFGEKMDLDPFCRFIPLQRCNFAIL